MEERYTRLFSLPENLYSAGAPVMIAAGALLKDNQTGKVLAQLKLCSLVDRAKSPDPAARRHYTGISGLCFGSCFCG